MVWSGGWWGYRRSGKGGGGGGGEEKKKKKEERKLVTEVEFCVFDSTADRSVFTEFLKTSFSLQPDCCSHLFGSVHVLRRRCITEIAAMHHNAPC